jgi:hypothetical protein
MPSPENLKQLVVRDNGRVEHNSHRFDMTGGASPDLLIGRSGKRSPGVSHDRFDHTFDTPEGSLGIKETACGKGCPLELGWAGHRAYTVRPGFFGIAICLPHSAIRHFQIRFRHDHRPPDPGCMKTVEGVWG